ncbi:lipopolysaccharide cholinephosphotransferase [Butyrivibrio fibrisolvens]|uniref:Lipopolysaccharide cholinephosphotransferase n=1 Tax=Butyrivibrio fibrisolvens TaxID=831 RepID=A0A1H9TV46_BUTFI|nr:LicD family protein [Butyrivibrio fibrisolvens]SES00797.1 lipopolysaccharide cholinephosphotransferase [Butyrivibrio fibrisolvens]
MVFQNAFFEEEVREGFTVSSMMKRAWAAELEVLDVVKKVCAEHDIKWYAFFGTLLGAVRHKGYIPWDDDIDICMLREDYMKFMSVAQEALPEGFVNPGIYGGTPRLWEIHKEPQGRVMADETFFSLPKYMNYFHAFPYPRIGIDIFPLDNLPRDPKDQLELVRKINDLQWIAQKWSMLKGKNMLESRLEQYERDLGISFDKEDEIVSTHEILCACDRYASSVPESESDAIANVLYIPYPRERDHFAGFLGMKKRSFGEGIELPFEEFSIMAPCEPVPVLTYLYGEDYMTPVKFTASHGYPFYRTQEEEFAKMWREAGNQNTVEEFCANWQKINEF